MVNSFINYFIDTFIKALKWFIGLMSVGIVGLLALGTTANEVAFT